MNQGDPHISYIICSNTRIILLIVLSVCFFCLGVQADPQDLQNSTPLGGNSTHHPQQIIVMYKPGMVNNSYSYSQISSKANSQVAAINVTRLNLMNVDFELVTLPENISVDSAVGIYLNNSDVLSASPNFVPNRYTRVPDDPSYPVQWAYRNTGQPVNGISGTAGDDINAEAAWNFTTGNSSVIVGLEDSGVDIFHPDLVNKLEHKDHSYKIHES